MKEWLRRKFIEKLGGYSDIDSAIEAIKSTDLENKYRILTLAVKRLFNTIDADDILHIHRPTGAWMFQNRSLANEERDVIIAEAERFSSSKLWKLLQDDIKYQANRKMFILSKHTDDLVAGKFWLYTLDVLNTRLESLTKKIGSFSQK